MPSPSLSMIVPAYAEALRLPATLRRLRAYLDEAGEPYEVIVVDDGSPDATVAVAEEHAAEWPELSVLRLATNRGKGAAVREGMLRARGANRAFSDADLSTPIEELPRLRAALGGDCRVAIASRDLPGSDIVIHQPAWREFMGRMYNRLLRALVLPGLRDTQCGFKVYEGEAAAALFGPLRTEGFGFDAEVLVRARSLGWTVAEVPVRWRHVEASRVRGSRDSVRMLWDLLRLRLRRPRGVSPRPRPAPARGRPEAARRAR